jgi:hypothetical protein
LDVLPEYQQFFISALDEFCTMYWPCRFSNEKGRCVNVHNRHHPKGHQNSKGKIIAAGGYESDGFSARDFGETWTVYIQNELATFQAELKELIDGPGQDSEKDYMWKLHMKHMEWYYGKATKQFISHSTCFCCLMAVPEHVLPCGHVLCTRCVKTHGKGRGSKVVFELISCPIHAVETSWQQPWVIRFKPDFAGVRLLCLDGYILFQMSLLRVTDFDMQWWYSWYCRTRSPSSHPKGPRRQDPHSGVF